MARDLTRKRMRVILLAGMTVFSLFGLKLFHIQGIDAHAHAAKAVEAGTRTTVVPAPRGTILDRNGADLATSSDGMSLTADPKETAKNAPKIASVLRAELGTKIDYFATIEKLRTPDSRFVYLVRDLPAATGRKVLKALSDKELGGVFSEGVSLRGYPGGSLAANILGVTDADGKGLAGLEASYNAELTGKDGSTTFEVSHNGERIPMAESTVDEMEPGKTIRTTIDRDLQWYADQRLADVVESSGADYGLAVTMDVRTCQIVQLSQVPTFDPDSRKNINSGTLVNRAVSNVYEPGSVMKPITMAALADMGKIASDSKITVPGSMVVDRFPISDYWAHGTLQLTAAGVIAKSSNLGTIVAARQMDNKTFHDYLTKFGFGKKTGIDLPEESAGLVDPADAWTKAKHATTSFGQGISINAIQMVRAIGAIANGGTMCQPHLVEATVDEKGAEKRVDQGQTEQVVSREAAAEVTRMMEAVTAPDGTAPAAAIEGYRVAGKTGTAWRVNPKTGRYVRGQNTISFIGFAPADAPRFVTYVVIDKPPRNAGGGSMAGPVFNDIMSMALERFAVVPTGAKPPKIKQEW